jgi:hypothetical protein
MNVKITAKAPTGYQRAALHRFNLDKIADHPDGSSTAISYFNDIREAKEHLIEVIANYADSLAEAREMDAELDRNQSLRIDGIVARIEEIN